MPHHPEGTQGWKGHRGPSAFIWRHTGESRALTHVLLIALCAALGLGAICDPPRPPGPSIKDFQAYPRYLCPQGRGNFRVVWTTSGSSASLVITDSSDRERFRRDGLPGSGEFNQTLPLSQSDRTPGKYSVVLIASNGQATSRASLPFEIVGPQGSPYTMTVMGSCEGDRCIGFGPNLGNPSDAQNRAKIPPEFLDPLLVATRTTYESGGTSSSASTIQSFAASHAMDSLTYCNINCQPPHEYDAPRSWKTQPAGDYLFNGSFSGSGINKGNTYSYVTSLLLICSR
jgi:hypothetical protein